MWPFGSEKERKIDFTARRARINAAPLALVKPRICNLLADATKMICVAEPVQTFEGYDDFAVEIREFLCTYRSVRNNYSDITIGRDFVGKAKYGDGFLRVGWDTDHLEIVVPPTLEAIFQLDGVDPPGSAASYTTIYHYFSDFFALKYPELALPFPFDDPPRPK